MRPTNLILWPSTPRPLAPNDIAIPGTFECYGWWENHPGLTSPGGGPPIATTSPTINGMAAWATANLQNWGSGQADPDGGNNAFLVQETVDGGATQHSADSICSNMAGPTCDLILWGKPINRDWMLVWETVANEGVFVNFATGGTALFTANASADDLGADAGGRWFRVKVRDNSAAGGNFRVYSANATPTHNYVGTGLVCCHIYGAYLNQTQLSTFYDLSLSAGVPRAHDMTQVTIANRQLVQDTISQVNNLDCPWAESGRDAFCRCATATLTGVVSGTDQPFATIGVGSMTGAFGQLNRWYHDANNYVNPFYISGADLRSVRNGALGNDTQMIQIGGAAQFATARSYAYIFNSNRTGALYVDGAQIGTFTHGAAGAITMAPGTYYNNQPAGPVTTAQTPASAVFKGQVPGSTFTEQYEWLAKALRPMARRWGVPS